MNWWFTPISFILTLVIYIAPPIILRFAVFRKPIEHKKARNFSLIYGAVFLIILAFVSKEMAILQALFIIPIFGVVNYFILAGIKENITGQIYLRQRFWLILSNIVCTILFFIFFSSPEMFKDMYLQSFVILFLPFHFFCFYKYKKVKGNIETEPEWKEKLKKENIESKTEE